MKAKTKIIITILVVLYIGLIIVVKIAEHNGTGMIGQSYNILGTTMREQLRDLKAAADGNAVYDPNAYATSDKTNQLFADYVESVKEIFRGNEHLLESVDEVDLTIDLKMFKQGKEFRFGDMYWNITLEQLENIVPYSLREDSERTNLPGDCVYYVSEEKYVLYGQKASATFQVADDQLKAVFLEFSSAKKPKALYDSVVEALHDICGEASEQFAKETTGYAGYKWEAENTMLQVSTDGTHIVICVGLR